MYLDLVCVQQNQERYLFRAPAWSSIEIGDSVVVEGNATGKVINLIHVYDDDNVFRFIVDAAGESLPLRKIIGKLEYVEMRYLGEDYGNDSKEQNS